MFVSFLFPSPPICVQLGTFFFFFFVRYHLLFTLFPSTFPSLGLHLLFKHQYWGLLLPAWRCCCCCSPQWDISSHISSFLSYKSQQLLPKSSESSQVKPLISFNVGNVTKRSHYQHFFYTYLSLLLYFFVFVFLVNIQLDLKLIGKSWM